MSNETIEVARLALEGDGVGRLVTSAKAGQVAFVPYSLPGEIVQGSQLLEKKNYSRWLPARVIKSSPERVDPPCAFHFKTGTTSNWCGGCDWQHIVLTAQRRSKRDLVKETLERLGKFQNPPVTEIMSAGSDLRYRNKVQIPFRVKKTGVPERLSRGSMDSRLRGNDEWVAGFFAPGSHDVVEFNDCVVQSDLSVKIFQAVKKIAIAAQWPAYDEDAHRGWLRHLLIRTNRKGQALVTFVTLDGRFPDAGHVIGVLRAECPSIIGIHQNIQTAQTNVILGRAWKSLWGENKIQEDMAGLTLSYAVSSFFQVNTDAAEILYQKVIDEAALDASSDVIDLYCGVGALSLLAARKSRYVLGVEEVPSSIRDAKANAAANGLTNVEFIESSVEGLFSEEQKDGWDRYDPSKLTVVVDPPRTGCDPTVMRGLMNVGPRRLVYVSCNPATLARDLSVLAPAYHLQSATPVDLFPHTSHIEVVATMVKKK